MKQDITIRPLKKEDSKEWRDLWTAYLEFYETSLDDIVFETSFDRLLSSEPGEYQCLMAEVEGKAVGLAHFLYHRSMWSVEDTCYLMDLFCAPEFRGNGVARKLIETVHRTAKRDGVPNMYWLTQEFNYKGRMLYDTLATRTPFIVYEK